MGAELSPVVSQQPRPPAPSGLMVQSIGGGVRGGSFPEIESGQASGSLGPDTGFSLGSLTPPGGGRPSSTNRSPWSRKLIYDEKCDGWLTVRYDECPVAFEDPRFGNHGMFCNNPMMSRLYSGKVKGIWTWPEWGYCPTLPACLACPVLGDCGGGGGWFPPQTCSRSSCSGWTGWNPLMQQLQGECLTADRGRFFCYVEEYSPCSDTAPSVTFPGRFWSYDA